MSKKRQKQQGRAKAEDQTENTRGKVPDLPNLTALRGLAAIAVAVFHFDSHVLHLSFPKESFFLRHCFLFVDFFFILSGFIMLHVYHSRFEEKVAWLDYRNFLRARIARIYPLHLFTLLILIVLTYTAINPYMSGELLGLINNPSAIPTNLVLLQSFGIHEIGTWNSPSWSISAEWCAYLLFPILAWSVNKQKGAMTFILFTLSAILYVSLMYYLPRSSAPWNQQPGKDFNLTYDWGYLRGLAGFMAGMVTYCLYLNKWLIQFCSKDLVGILSGVSLLVALNKNINHLIYIPLFMFLILSVAANKNWINKICKLKSLQHFGDISYSVYMIHYILILCVAIPIVDHIGFDYTGPGHLKPPLYRSIPICAGYLVLVISISSLSYRFVEKPCRAWINRKQIQESPAPSN